MIPSALDLGVEVVALDLTEGIDGEKAVWVVFFDVVVEVVDKPELVAEDKKGEEFGDCLDDDISDEVRGEESIGFGPRP